MGSHNYGADCPKCKCVDSLNVTSNNRPFESVSGECIECGWSYWTISGQMGLEELNEVRNDYDMEELSELPKIELTEDEIKNSLG